jgi:DNA-binding GntR family transcriptional regulator
MKRLLFAGILGGVGTIATIVLSFAGGPGCDAYYLRQRGPSGLAEFLAHYDEQLSQPFPAQHFRDALDVVCAQRDCYASRLYWYTDLDAALAAARAENKPILSLRLLGNLDDDFSCANSRFFRTALYADEAISTTLRERFVLHWQSVRPIPVLRVDMGDGRELKRTVTGNSVHYVLDAEGRVFDALPGLYGPQAFLEWLDGVHRQIGVRLDQDRFEATRRMHHERRLFGIAATWEQELLEPAVRSELQTDYRSHEPFVDAARAGDLAMCKVSVEAPLISSLLSRIPDFEAASDGAFWARIAERYADKARLGGSARKLLEAKLFGGTAAVTDADVARLARTIDNFERRMAEDGVRNELTLHRRIHQWFIDGEVDDLDRLNDRVYDELFATPMEDAWLGLVPPDTYAALDSEGITVGR